MRNQRTPQRRGALFPKLARFFTEAVHKAGIPLGNPFPTSYTAFKIADSREKNRQREKKSGIVRDGFGGVKYDKKKDQTKTGGRRKLKAPPPKKKGLKK
jgi:hypothetical protein